MIQKRFFFGDFFKSALPIILLVVFWWEALPLTVAWAENGETILRIHGSNTMGPRIVADLARQYLKIIGAAEIFEEQVSPGSEIDVTGRFPEENLSRIIEIRAHGTSTGFKSLKEGKCDIAMASRRITPAEASELAALGDMNDVACEHVVALDGVAIIVHPDNQTVSSVDLNTLARIFSGKIDNWSQLGGPDEPIHLHVRNEDSGTQNIFKEMVLEKRLLS